MWSISVVSIHKIEESWTSSGVNPYSPIGLGQRVLTIGMIIETVVGLERTAEQRAASRYRQRRTGACGDLHHWSISRRIAPDELAGRWMEILRGACGRPTCIPCGLEIEAVEVDALAALDLGDAERFALVDRHGLS